MTQGLVIFNLDENAAVLSRVRALVGVLDEIVVIDSSSPSTADELALALAPFHARVVRVLPLGYGDILRGFGVRQATSDCVLLLDADEEPSVELAAALPTLVGRDGWIVPRYEAGLRSYTYHLRLLRRQAARYRGRSYEFPQIEGLVAHLAPPRVLIHHIDPKTYLTDKGRAERYFTVESYERPLTRAYAREAFALRAWRSRVRLPLPPFLFREPGTLLSDAGARFVIAVEAARDVLLGRGLSAAAFNYHYSVSKWRFFRTLPYSEQAQVTAIAEEVRRSGGLLEYLDILRPGYLEQLTASFSWDRSGLEVFRELLSYRHEHGRPMRTWPGA